MKTVVPEPQAPLLFPEGVLLVNPRNDCTFGLTFRAPYRMEAETDIRAMRRGASTIILKHKVSTAVTEGVLVVASRVDLLPLPHGGRNLEYAERFRMAARLQFFVGREEIFKGCPLDLAYDAAGPLANPPDTLFYDVEGGGKKWKRLGVAGIVKEPNTERRLGLLLPNASIVSLRIKDVPAHRGGIRLRTNIEAAVYTTRM